MAAALGGGADDDFDQFDKPGAERSWRRRAGDDDWDSELDDDLLGEDLLTGKKNQSDLSDEELNDDLLQSDNEEEQEFRSPGVTVSLNATSGMLASYEISESINDPSLEHESEYDQGEDEIGYDKSEAPEEYASEYAEEGHYEGNDPELTEDQIEYGEEPGEEDEVLDLEINEPLDEFPDEDYMQSYNEQAMEEQGEYTADEELEESQTMANESEEAAIGSLELQEETKEESDEEEDDDEESGRLRFKTERKEGTIIRLSDVTRERRNIPETLELSAEAQAALREFEERERQLKQGRYGSRRGGRRGGSIMCHGMGEQRRDNNDRGRIKDHRPALLPNQPSTMHQHHSSPPPGLHMPPPIETPRIMMTPPPVTPQQPKNIHINPHFKGTVVTPVQVPLLPVPAQPRPAVGPQRFPGPPDFQQHTPGPVPTNFSQAPRLPIQDQWRGPPPPPPPLPPPPPQDRDPFFIADPRFPGHPLFEQRSPPPPPPPPLLNSAHPVPAQSPMPFSQPGPAFSQQGQQPVYPRERPVRPNMQPQGPVGILHFNQPGSANPRPFIPPRQQFLQAPGQPFLSPHTQPSMQGPMHPPLQPQPQPQPQQHHHQQQQQHHHQQQQQQHHHHLQGPPQPLMPMNQPQFRPHIQATQQQPNNNRMQCQPRQGPMKPRHSTPSQNIVKRSNQQLQSSAPRNSNLRELPIAPSHAMEMSNNRRNSTPAAQVKPITSTVSANKSVGGGNSQGRPEVKAKAVTPVGQAKSEGKSEPEYPDEDEETRLYRLKIEEQKRLREEILKQKELRRQQQAGARKRELLERLAQQQQQQPSTQQSYMQHEDDSSEFPTNGSPYIPHSGLHTRHNVKNRLLVRKQDTVVPNIQPKPTEFLQSVVGDVQYQGQQMKPVKQLRQTRTVPPSQPQAPQKVLQTKPAAASLPTTQTARVASVPARPQEQKPGVKRTVMQRTNSGSDGPHVGSKVRVIKLSGGVIMHGRGRGVAGQMGRGRLMPNKQNLRVVECKPQPCIVSVEGLSSSTTDVQLKNLLMSVGPIQSLQMLPQQRKAIAKFKEPAHALAFQQKFHRHMIDLSHINVALIVE
ncbi:RNA-binding protein 33 isoform X5 [Chiroxiphia lanceolata]|uniref:RNA-binding protein 33 isoform X5 n=1 Tax=Chiroxiphia lanceolata TaxID=296741 RepID=UPI0013CE8D6E|nr:RNA-binding protein 33 isoform X5 [Chiroxiphia lanceolata]